MSVMFKSRILLLAAAVVFGFSLNSIDAQPLPEGDDAIASDQDSSAPVEENDLERVLPPIPESSFNNQPNPNLSNNRRNQTPARQASQRRSTQSAPQNFNVRLARAPKMLGDFFGRGGLTTTAPVHVPDEFDEYGHYELMEVNLPNPSAGDIIGRGRLQDNNGPLPQDRIFFDYSYFHNVPFYNGIDVNRFTPGVEKTFWDGMASLELRVPMGVSLDNQITVDAPNDVSNYEFGNISLITKFLLTSSDECALAAGLGISFATADDLDVGMENGLPLVSIENESTHLIPYLAYLYTPRNSNCFLQSFITFDFDTQGNDVSVADDNNQLRKVGVWQDQHLANVSLSGGSWIYENYSRYSCLKRIAWSVEAHYTATLNDADTIYSNDYVVGDPNSELSLVNGTVGGHVTLYQTTFTAGYSVPFDSIYRVFDGEFRFFVNRLF